MKCKYGGHVFNLLFMYHRKLGSAAVSSNLFIFDLITVMIPLTMKIGLYYYIYCPINIFVMCYYL